MDSEHPFPKAAYQFGRPMNAAAKHQRVHEQALLERAALRAWDRVLVLASGDGWLAEEAWRRLQRGYVCGLEGSRGLAANAATTRGIVGQLEYLAWDCASIPFENGFFDRILGNSVIERCPAPGELMCEMRRVLRTHGEILLLERNDIHVQAAAATAHGNGRLHKHRRSKACITELATIARLEPRYQEDLYSSMSMTCRAASTLFSLVPLPEEL